MTNTTTELVTKRGAYFSGKLPEAADDLQGIKKNRLKVGSESFDSPEQVKQKIFGIISKAPITPGDLQSLTNYSQPQIWRYTKALAAEGRIVKNGEYWTVSGTQADIVQREKIDDLVNESKFFQLQEIQDFVLHNKNLASGKRWLAQLRKICIGEKVPGFKIHPANWTVETTPVFLKALRQHTGKERLTLQDRQLIRYIHQYLLNQPITETQKEQWGLDGRIDVKGAYAHIKLTDAQIQELGQFHLDNGDLETAAYVRGGIELFARPNRWFMAELAKFEEIEKSVTLAHVEGFEPIIVDGKMQMLLAAFSSSGSLKVRFETKVHRILTGQIFESKTDKTWTKFVKDAKAVEIVKEYMGTRKGKQYFFAGDESWESFYTRMSKTLRAGYDFLGIADKYCKTKPMYSLRHFGAHLWLKRTGYNYGAVAEMGWEDLQTLRKWYGAFDHAQLDRFLVE